MRKWFVQLLCAVTTATSLFAQEKQLTVPLGGNSWVTTKAGNERVTNSGWVNWQQPGTVFSTFIHVHQPGTLI
ncbi:MAG: DUF5077 domain-containing protein, partial [Chitinophagaceae bacterium]|nr:DUF5077 domain-containing protein [Chitinophagaceae bacterium]